MDNQYTQKDISLDLLLDYVFKRLTPQEDSALEAFLDEHGTYNDLVDGIFNYCLNKNIKNKNDLEKDLAASQESFFTKFPDLAQLNLEEKKPSKSNRKRNGWGLILLLLLLVGPVLVWKIGTTPNVDEQNKTEETQQEPSTNNSSTKPKTEEIDSKSLKENPQNPKLKNEAPIENKTPKDNPSKEKKPILFAEVRSEIEKMNPIGSSALEFLNKDLKVRGDNSQIEEAEQLLVEGKATQRVLFTLGLHELTKNPPNFNRAIELLSQVQQYEFTDATWFLFRAYLLANKAEEAKIEFQKMRTPPADPKYYEDRFLKNLPESVKSFFQSKGN